MKLREKHMSALRSEAKLFHALEVSPKDVAIIGIGAKLPSGSSINEFWNKLKGGQDFIKSVPPLREKDIEEFLRISDVYFNDEQNEAALLDEIDKFDYEFFNLTPKEAELMDPAQRLFLQVAWETIEDAGYGGEKLKGSRTGVFVGYGSDADYKRFIVKTDPALLGIGTPGNIKPIIASRLQYILDLHGPSMIIDTTCSSSLVAIHLACMSIRNGECDAALAGGVQLHLIPRRQANMGIESKDGRTRTFDQSSDGTGSGEGIGCVLLKPLTQAIQDRDPIYAVIKGTSINHDGKSLGLTAPNMAAQEDVLVRAWEDAKIDPETIAYIEAHGSGTKLGDPIEVEAITNAFRRYTNKKQFCGIGSVKSNLGHLDSASGIAGFLKCVLSLKHQILPASLHFKRPNEKINFVSSPVYVVSRTQGWEKGAAPRRCGVSSFGISGTNCHLVIEEYVDQEKQISEPDNSFVFTISARNDKALLNYAVRYIDFINLQPKFDLGDLCYTSNMARGHYSYRLAIICRSFADLREKLLFFLGNQDLNASVLQEKEIYFTQSEHMTKLISKSSDSFRKNREEMLRHLSLAYIHGNEDANFEIQYAEQVIHRRSIPSYPFEKKRCWLDVSKARTSRNTTERGLTASNVHLSGKESNMSYTEIERIIGQIWSEVLGYKNLSVYDNFFEIGGDSLTSQLIITRVKKHFSVDLTLQQILEMPTIAALSLFVIDQQKKEAATEGSFEYAPASSSQMRMYMLNDLANGYTAYNLPKAFIFDGELDLGYFKACFQELIQLHASLRTSFVTINGEVKQKILNEAELAFEYTLINESDLDEHLEAFIQPFRLDIPSLFRIGWFQISERKAVFALDMHHIIVDGLSSNILMRDFIRIYQGERLKKPDLQYKDYVLLQNSWLNSPEYHKQEQYWKQQLASFKPTELKEDSPRSSFTVFRGDRVKSELDETVVHQLQSLALQTQTTVFMVLLAAYNVLLSRLTGNLDIVVGTPVSGRTKEGFEETVGLFVNTLVLRNKILAEDSFSSLLKQVKENALNAFSHQDYPFEHLVEKLKIKRELNRNPIVSNLFVYHTQPQSLKLPGITIQPYPIQHQVSRVDTTMELFSNPQGIVLYLEYNSTLFKRATMEQLMTGFTDLIQMLIVMPDQLLFETLDNLKLDQAPKREMKEFDFSF